jgi:hypothetical protein
MTMKKISEEIHGFNSSLNTVTDRTEQSLS